MVIFQTTGPGDLRFPLLYGCGLPCLSLDLQSGRFAVARRKDWREGSASYDGLVCFPLRPDLMRHEIEALVSDNSALFERVMAGREGEGLSEDAMDAVDTLTGSALRPFIGPIRSILDSADQLSDFLSAERYPAHWQSLREFVEDILSHDGEDGVFWGDRLRPFYAMRRALLSIWAEDKEAGELIPSHVEAMLQELQEECSL